MGDNKHDGVSVGMRRPQLNLSFLIALTAVAATLFTINNPLQDVGALDAESTLRIWLVIGFGVARTILSALAITQFVYGIISRSRGGNFLRQPGHWLIVEIATTAIASALFQ